MNDDKIIEKLKILIKEGNNLSEELHEYPYSYQSSDLMENKEYYQEAKKWEGISANLLKLRFGENSEYFKDFINSLASYQNSGEYFKGNIKLATAVLEYIFDALKEGLTDDLFYKREILIFSDLLKQAEEFLEKGHKLISAIYGRIALEVTIKEFAKKNGIVDEKFDQIIIKLRQGGYIHEPLENSLRANYKIGSWATHGNEEFNKLSDSEIREFLAFIRDKILTL